MCAPLTLKPPSGHPDHALAGVVGHTCNQPRGGVVMVSPTRLLDLQSAFCSFFSVLEVCF